MSGHCTVILHEDRWRLLCVVDHSLRSQVIDCAPDADLQSRAKSLADACTLLGASGPVVLAIPSGWCLSATIGTGELGRTGRRQAMRFMLEEHLPLSAEDAVVDFVQRQDSALGVAVELDRLRPIIEALREAGVAVAHVCPAVFLAASDLMNRHPSAQTLCLADPQGVNLIGLDHQLPIRWWWLPDRAALAEPWQAWFGQDGEPTGRCLVLGEVPPIPGVEITRLDADEPADQVLDRAIADASSRLLDGSVSAWIDLCQDELGAPARSDLIKKNLGYLAASIAMLLICLGLSAYWRGQQYADQASASNNEQITVYKDLMPGQRVPASIHSRLQSEHRRLAGLGGLAQAGEAEPGGSLHPTSALTHLQRLIAALPQSLRWRLSDLSIEPGLIRVNGQAPDSVIPERLAAALRDTGHYVVDQPNSRALSGFGFSFGFIARPAQPPDRDPLIKEASR